HLAKPLTLDAAVAIALVHNPTLQATFEQVGVSQADLAQAASVENPELSGLVRFPSEGPGRNTELSLMLNVFDLFLQPVRKQVAAAELEQAKLRVAHEVLALAADVKEAYLTLQARQQLVARLGLIRDLTATAGDFARRQHEAGTINDLELENRTVLDREARVEVARAQAEVRADRERLNRLLGLWGARTAWTVEDELPAIPEQEVALDGLERHAVARRQDLQAARWGVDLVGRALALRRKTRFLPVGLHVGINTEKEVTGDRVTGPELALQLPLFDTGRASIARLTAEHRRAQRQLEALAVDARAEVREQRDRLLAARDLALFYERELLPQRARILDLTLRQYNAMFKGAYDLLLAKQAEVEAERARLDAWRDYWIARARLEKAVGGALPAVAGSRGTNGATVAPEGEGR
ncbi:MAG TPA: TolC family protein, partial [Vicinamibacteria bacterium]|nr:TolC family protein [Vicinamibacteria bacterium]